MRGGLIIEQLRGRAAKVAGVLGGNSVYVGFMLASNGLGVINSLLLAKMLGARGFGYYTLIPLALPLGTSLANFGVVNALASTLPQAYARNEDGLEDVKARALGTTLIMGVTFAVPYLAVLTLLAPHSDGTALALYFVSAASLLAVLYEFSMSIMRSQLQLVRVGAASFAAAAAAFTATVVAAIVWGYSGAIVAESLALIPVLAVIIVLWHPFAVPRRPDLREAMSLIRAGVPLTLRNIMFAAGYMADRYFVAARLPRQFGQYAFASIVVVIWTALTGVIAQAVNTRVLYDFGAGVPIAELQRRLRRVLGSCLLWGAPPLLILILLIPPLKSGPLSDYASGLDVMPILYVGGLLSLLSMYVIVLAALRRYALVLVTSGVGAVAAAVGGFFVAITSPSLSEFAWVLVGSQALAAIVAFVVTDYVAARA